MIDKLSSEVSISNIACCQHSWCLYGLILPSLSDRFSCLKLKAEWQCSYACVSVCVHVCACMFDRLTCTLSLRCRCRSLLLRSFLTPCLETSCVIRNRYRGQVLGRATNRYWRFVSAHAYKLWPLRGYSDPFLQHLINSSCIEKHGKNTLW